MPAAGETIRVRLLWEEAGNGSGYWFAPYDKQIDIGDVLNWADAWIDAPARRDIVLLFRWKPNRWFCHRQNVTLYASRW